MSITCQLCKTELPDSAKFCLNCGADTKLSAQGKHTIVIRKFLEAVEAADVQTVENILRQDPSFANIRDTTIERATPLHYVAKAVVDGEDKRDALVKIVELLLDFGADVNAVMQQAGDTPLHAASHTSGSFRVVRLLVHHGAHIEAQNNKHETPLQRAHQKSNDAIIDYLASQGANPNVKNDAGFTPLWYAEHEVRLLQWQLKREKSLMEQARLEEKIRRAESRVELLKKHGAVGEE